MKSLKKNNVLIVILFAIAVFMSVGFAVLSTTLNINGQAVVKSNTWDIHFENVVITDGSSTAIKEAVIANEDATLVEYEVALAKPGDYYEFTVDAVNDGTINAEINLVTLTGADSEYVNYQVTYLNGANINIGDALAAGVSETYKVRVEYKKDIDNVPNEDITLSLVFGVTYNQGKGTTVITDYYTLTGIAYDELGNPLTGGEVEVHSKVVTAPIGSDGTYTLKNIQVGNHEIIIKNELGEIIGEDTFTLQTGDKFRVEDNNISATKDTKITVDVQVLSENVELTKYIKKYEVGTEVEVDSVYDFISSDKLTDTGNYTLIANGVTIAAEVFVIDEDKTYTATPTLCSATADTKMCLIKYNGDLTINSGVTIQPQVRKKGFVIYVEGTLTNNGTISMTARGAKATGQNVYLYKNESGTFEYVPAVGGVGGASASTTGMTAVNGKAGTNGTNRKTGGGGSGAADNQYSKATSVSGAGGAGTSYSGGAGGAGIYNESYNNTITGQAGSSTGGAGGSFTGTITSQWGADGGAGNPGGTSSASTGNGEDGTGGLLIIYSNDFVNVGTINSNGSKGGASGGKQEPGGSSGGGSINIFYNEAYTNSGTIVASGGAKANFKTLTVYGGAGGAGSVTIGSIETGTFVKN